MASIREQVKSRVDFNRGSYTPNQVWDMLEDCGKYYFKQGLASAMEKVLKKIDEGKI